MGSLAKLSSLGLTDILQTEPDFCVSATLIGEAVMRMAEQLPDVILLNVSLLEAQLIKMILLTSFEEREAILDAFTIGVLNVVDKTNYRDDPRAHYWVERGYFFESKLFRRVLTPF